MYFYGAPKRFKGPWQQVLNTPQHRLNSVLKEMNSFDLPQQVNDQQLFSDAKIRLAAIWIGHYLGGVLLWMS